MQNAPLESFCNTFDLHKAIIGLENQVLVFLRVDILDRFYCTVELQWLEQAWDFEKIVLAKGTQCSSSHSGWTMHEMSCRGHGDSGGDSSSQPRCMNHQSSKSLKFYCIRSLYRHMVCNVQVSCKANGDRNHLEAGLDSDLIVE